MESVNFEDLTEEEKQFLTVYRQLDNDSKEKTIKFMKRESKKKEAKKLLEELNLQLTDEEKKYMMDLMRYDTLTEERKKEVMDYHIKEGFTVQVIEGVKNISIYR